MKKVAFVTPGAFPVPSSMGGSVERVVEKFVPKLQPHVAVTIYGRLGRGLRARDHLEGAPIERYNATNKRRYFDIVCKRLQLLKPHTIQIENRPRWVPRLKKLMPHCQIWLNLHSTTFISAPYLKRRDRLRCLMAADRIIVNSAFLRSYIVGMFPRLASIVSVNHLGVDVEQFAEKGSTEWKAIREKVRTAKKWGQRPIVMFVGRLIPQKGVHHLLASLRHLIVHHPNVLVIIVGSALYGSHRTTPYVRKLHRLAGRWRKHVHFQPYIPHHEVAHWLAMADIAVVPSIGKEAFGLVNVEAMAAGLPVIATNTGGIREVVSDGETGYLVSKQRSRIVSELSSRISELLSNSELREQMGRKGRQRVLDHFTWNQTAQRWLKLHGEQ
ncbi:MAG: glycosyltransferase family 4 protein [Candidatus Cohnella colombiensis]|uniref:Glycosyltransferase family 4 protein n=1 Tax=Candidatus Cohnella colombiensis TaxID=3121368 RepID=A0AA95ETX7_9BACL|nr:MAG: glycosyltransferase family 4 protein [Cohnella sp.]